MGVLIEGEYLDKCRYERSTSRTRGVRNIYTGEF